MTAATQAEQLRAATEQTLVAAVDAGAIGFMEMRVAAGLAAIARNGTRLNLEQARQAWRILSRNEDRLTAAGLTLPARSAVSTPPVAPTPTSGPGRPALALRADGRIGISHPPFALNEALKSDAYASWDKVRKQWHVAATPACAAAAMAVLGPHDPQASPRVLELCQEFASLATRRLTLDPTSPVPGLDLSDSVLRHADLWEHQLRAVDYASSASAFLLAVTMGGGKTAAAIATANRVEAKRLVIVCPNKVRGVWPHQVSQWTKRRWHVVDGKRPARQRGRRAQDLAMAERLEQAEACLFDCACGALTHAVVFNYEMLVHEPVASWVPPILLDMVIYDEGHALKSPTGRISRRAADWVSFFHRRVALTGTPMPQYPWDIFGLYRALDPGIFGPLWSPFKAAYLHEAERKDDGRKFPVAILKDRRAEFARKVHSIMYRPTVDLKLPGAHHVIRRVELEPAARREYVRLEEQMWADLSAFSRSTDAEIDSEPMLIPSNILARRIRLRQLTGGTLPDDGEVQEDGKTVRQKYRVSTAKQEELAEVLDEIGCVAGRQDGPEPVCVYSAFLDDLTMVRELAERQGLRYREVSGRRGDGLNERSQMAEDADVLGVQIDSGGTGVDLTRACYGVWYSVGEKVGPHDQALKRQDRPGQTRPVQFIHLVAVDTMDETVYRALATRRSVTGTFLATRGISPALAGLADDDVAPELTLDEVEAQLNERRAAEGGGTRSGGVRLPIDDYAATSFQDPHPAPTRGRRAVDDDALREYGLEGLV